jgi:hypothetical protein
MWALLILGMKTGRDDWELCSESFRFSARNVSLTLAIEKDIKEQ